VRFVFVAALVVMLAALATALAGIRANQAAAGPRQRANAEPQAAAAAAPATVAGPQAPPSPPSPAVVVDPPAVAPPAPASVLPAPAPVSTTPISGGLADGWGSAAAPELDPRPFSEAHWQGLEVIPKTATLAQTLNLPADAQGVIVDDVSLPADLQGFRAGDLVTSVAGVPTPDLMSFIRAAERVREERQVEVETVRGGAPQRLRLSALFERLGTANGETPTMIPPGARSPHRYQGPCTKCHRIGTTGSLATDQGDTPVGSPIPIRSSASPPHRDRGPCSACHQILP
jgi:Magnetochrome domain